ncbi:hypothetical protein EDB80DRAFT_717664 [Ilyonectria destructans]|nr:hypothetical protein EDB80DRAFT_717664 [Ilyonectria destructans]
MRTSRGCLAPVIYFLHACQEIRFLDTLSIRSSLPFVPSTLFQSTVTAMFGRRRRPILGAAVVVGASRMAAKREVKKQAMRDSERDFEIEREVETRRRQEEEQERRTQRAVDDAMDKAATDRALQQSAAAMVPQPPQQFYNTQPPMPIQTRDDGFLMSTPGQPYTPGMNAALSIQPEQLMRVPSPQMPAYLSGSPSQDGRPRSAGPGLGSNARFCTQCGFACQAGDRFCCRCGAKQV